MKQGSSAPDAEPHGAPVSLASQLNPPVARIVPGSTGQGCTRFNKPMGDIPASLQSTAGPSLCSHLVALAQRGRGCLAAVAFGRRRLAGAEEGRRGLAGLEQCHK